MKQKFKAGFFGILLVLALTAGAVIVATFILPKQFVKQKDPSELSVPSPKIQNFTPSPSSTPSPNDVGETATWKTYSFDDCGKEREKTNFSFQLPSSWAQLQPNQSEAYASYSFSGPEGELGVACGTEFGGGGCKPIELKIGTRTTTGCYNGQTGDLSVAYLETENNTFSFTAKIKDKSFLDQILSTFQFLD